MENIRNFKNKSWRAVLLVCMMALSLCACDFHASDNGDLDGFWHLESIEDLQSGEMQHLDNQKLFWAYQVHLMYLQGASTGTFFLRFEHSNGTLRLYEPRRNGGHGEVGDPLVTDPSVLQPYGITALEESFEVEKLNGSTMVLRSGTYRLRFTKF